MEVQLWDHGGLHWDSSAGDGEKYVGIGYIYENRLHSVCW